MQTSPIAVLWYGTESVEFCPVNPERYGKHGEPMSFAEQDIWEQKLSALGVELVEFHGEGPAKYALALKGHYSRTDWDDDLILKSLDIDEPSALAILRAAMKEVGWPGDDVEALEWRLGADCW